MTDPGREGDHGRDVLRLRHRRARPNQLACLLSGVVLAYTFAEFGVYWLITGSGTVAAGTVSSVGALVWIGPIMSVLPIALIGDRGAFARLYEPRGIVDLTLAGLSWSTPCAQAASCARGACRLSA